MKQKLLFLLLATFIGTSVQADTKSEEAQFWEDMRMLNKIAEKRLNTIGTFVYCGTREHFESEINNINMKFKITHLQVMMGKTVLNNGSGYDQNTMLCAVLTK